MTSEEARRILRERHNNDLLPDGRPILLLGDYETVALASDAPDFGRREDHEQMPRRLCIRERLDKMWFDTAQMEAGQTVRLFESARIGDSDRTNMKVSGGMPGNETFLIRAVKTRILGADPFDEARLMDHVHLTLTIGDRPMFGSVGNSTAGAQIDPKLLFLAKEHNCPVDIRDLGSALVALDWLLEQQLAGSKPLIENLPLPNSVFGYVVTDPLMLPVRKRFHVDVRADRRLPRAIDLRVQLFGVLTRDVA